MKFGYPEYFLLYAGVLSFHSLTWSLSLAGISVVLAFVRLALKLQEKNEKKEALQSTATLLNEQAEELGQALAKLFNTAKNEVLDKDRKKHDTNVH